MLCVSATGISNLSNVAWSLLLSAPKYTSPAHFSFISGISKWNKNNQSPRLTVEARVVTKREDVGVHHHNDANGTMHTTHSTWYYVTFEVESGDRMEFNVTGNEYGMLIEGDAGKLTFQGTRYLGFERMR